MRNFLKKNEGVERNLNYQSLASLGEVVSFNSLPQRQSQSTGLTFSNLTLHFKIITKTPLHRS